jgi:hypothetical protein
MSEWLVIDTVPFIKDIFLDFAYVICIDDKISLVEPTHFTVIVHASIHKTTQNKLFVVKCFAHFIQRITRMIDGDLVNRVALRAWHIHCYEQSQGSLLTTVPSIRRFHLEFFPPGSGLLDFFAPIWRWWMRLTLAINGASTLAVCWR